MAKASKQANVSVRDTRTGKLVTVQGAGALKGRVLDIRKDVDLTKPIASQVLKSAKR